MIYHTIQQGDTLYNIAKRYGVSMNDILNTNLQIVDASVIHIGELIVVPAGDIIIDDTNSRITHPAHSVLAWGQKVSPAFREKVVEICDSLRINPSFLMACMAFETGCRFSASIRNPISDATGLIQFMPKTAKALGTTIDALAVMSAEEQLDYVKDYFSPYAGRLSTLEDVYMAILWPKAVGQSDDYVLFRKGEPAYKSNPLDINFDGAVTKAEAAYKVRRLLEKGLLPENASLLGY